MQAQTLGDEWFRIFYPRICASLNYRQSEDELARDLLSELLVENDTPHAQLQLEIIRKRTVIMFGAGPSLRGDLEGLTPIIQKAKPIVVGADGAADALYEAGMVPSIVVSDLDSCSQRNLKRNSQDGCVFVHAHGDNLSLIREIVPEMGERMFGTTQVGSVRNVVNYGGLTDGDRACFIVSSFDPSSIIIAGMDFGKEEGSFSRNRYDDYSNPLRYSKLTWGRKSLEFLIRERRDIRFVNVTRHGEEIVGATRMSYEELMPESF